MILDEAVDISTKNNKKLKHYKNLGYDVSMDIICVNVEDLPRSISISVKVKCDYCDKVHDRKLVDYNRIVDKSGSGKYACSRKCGVLKFKETIADIEKKPHVNKGKKIPPEKLDKINEKRKKTNLKKYGTEHVLQNESVKEKFKRTNIDRYGVDNYSKTQEFLEKQQQTCIEKYNEKHISQIESVKEKIKKTNLSRYGVTTTLQTKESIESRNRKFRDEEFRKNFDISNDENYIKYIGDSVSLFLCDMNKGHEFEIKYDNYRSRKKFNIPLCTTCYPISELISIKERQLSEFISSIYDGEIISNYRDKFEIDIFLPDMNLGFEFNGLYWHSDSYRPKSYHLDKKNHFLDRGITIFNIWEDDWTYNNEIIRSQIQNLLKKSKRIFARKCHVRKIDINISKKFLNENHIQGFNRSKIKVGLFFNNELVSIMTFDKFEGRKKMKDGEWNLSRFCNKLGVSVVGGASKLLNFFINEFEPKRIISYADKDWSSGNLYEKLGFEKVYETKPDYKYLVGDKRKHKSNFKNSLTGTKESLLDIPKVYDCGKMKFELII